MNKTGKIIQELRKNAGYTQKSLAEALHITDKAVSKWERGISLPDTRLLPKLSLILDTDIEVFISKNLEEEEWVGFIDINGCDFSQLLFDKPIIYYLLSHYLLLGITKIFVVSSQKNEDYLKKNCILQEVGFKFSFEKPTGRNIMIIDHPWFLFGSDLTQQFRGAMLSERDTKLVPDNQGPVVFFARNNNEYFTNKEVFLNNASKRTLGRGMVCLDMGNPNSIHDIAAFIRTYQSNSGLLIGSLEEIAYKMGYISNNTFYEYCKKVPYGELLREAGKPAVD